MIPQVQTGQVDAAIAGQSMMGERCKQVDFAGPYYYAQVVCVVKNDSEYANAASIKDLAGGICTAQKDTIWYDRCLPQIEDAQIQEASETASAMFTALEVGSVDFICADLPTAQSAAAAYSDMKILNFSGTDGDFQFTKEERDENVNIGIAVQKGNTSLAEAINSVLEDYTEEDFDAMMERVSALARDHE